MADRDYLVTVCDACRRTCCWHGELMCEEARGAGTAEVRASVLRLECRESSHHFSRGRIQLVTGELPNEVTND